MFTLKEYQHFCCDVLHHVDVASTIKHCEMHCSTIKHISHDISPTSDATRVFYVVIFPRRIGLSTGATTISAPLSALLTSYLIGKLVR